ncbi:MAG: Na+/H+ antiporter NhaC family protein [Bacillota bacterium]
MEFGFLSILPALVAIVLAIATRQVILSLFVAVWLGATFIYSFNPAVGIMRTLDEFILGSATDGWNAGILIFTMIIAAAIGLVTRSGGAQAIAEALARKAKTPRAGMLAAWFMGLVIFFDDYGSCLIAGNTSRPITDKLRVSREKLSYIVDSTAAPVATIAVISTWVGYEMGMISEGFATVGVEVAPYLVFLQSIPYRFYSLFAMAFILILAFTMRDFGPMYNAEIRARTTGKLLRDGAVPLSAGDTAELQVKEGVPLRWINFVLPLLTIIGGTIIGLYYNGGGAETGTFLDAIGNADASVVLLWSSTAGLVVALFLVLVQRILTLGEAMDTVMNGAKSVFTALVILVLAWSLSAVSSTLGAADYLSPLVAAAVPVWLVPFIVFVVACMVAFATGTSWGTMGILTPMAVPIAYAFGVDYIMIPTVAAVLTGAIFGDHCSPISDTTILSSTGSSCDHIDHVRTQLPYAIVTAVIAGVFGFIPAGFGIPWYVSLVLGVAAMYVIVKVVGKSTMGSTVDVGQKAKA